MHENNPYQIAFPGLLFAREKKQKKKNAKSSLNPAKSLLAGLQREKLFTSALYLSSPKFSVEQLSEHYRGNGEAHRANDLWVFHQHRSALTVMEIPTRRFVKFQPRQSLDLLHYRLERGSHWKLAGNYVSHLSRSPHKSMLSCRIQKNFYLQEESASWNFIRC